MVSLLPDSPTGLSCRDGAFHSSWLEQRPDPLFVTDTAGTISYVNPAFEALTGFSRGEAVGRKPSILKSGRQDGEFYRGLWRNLLDGQAFRGVFVNRRREGALFHSENSIWPVFDEHRRVVGFVCEMRDISERVLEREKLAHAATHDPLTDLPNRSLFLDRLELALRHAARREEGVAVAILDIDRFRDTNTRYGHAAGDALLQAVAKRTLSCVREGDTVARVGGDELALILPDVSGHGAAEPVLEKVRSTNAVPVRYEDRLIRITVSIGAAIYPPDGQDAETLRKHADRAMYAAKRAGGNAIRFCRPRRLQDGPARFPSHSSRPVSPRA